MSRMGRIAFSVASLGFNLISFQIAAAGPGLPAELAHTLLKLLGGETRAYVKLSEALASRTLEEQSRFVTTLAEAKLAPNEYERLISTLGGEATTLKIATGLATKAPAERDALLLTLQRSKIQFAKDIENPRAWNKGVNQVLDAVAPPATAMEPAVTTAVVRSEAEIEAQSAPYWLDQNRRKAITQIQEKLEAGDLAWVTQELSWTERYLTPADQAALARETQTIDAAYQQQTDHIAKLEGNYRVKLARFAEINAQSSSNSVELSNTQRNILDAIMLEQIIPAEQILTFIRKTKAEAIFRQLRQAARLKFGAVKETDFYIRELTMREQTDWIEAQMEAAGLNGLGEQFSVRIQGLPRHERRDLLRVMMAKSEDAYYYSRLRAMDVNAETFLPQFENAVAGLRSEMEKLIGETFGTLPKN